MTLTCDTCGHTTATGTPAQVSGWLDRHSCERARWRQARRERRAAMESAAAAVDRTPKPCTHERVTHQHGTAAAYARDHCRCEPCVKAWSVTKKRERFNRESNPQSAGYRDAALAKHHITLLRQWGVSLDAIAAQAGVSRLTLLRALKHTRTTPTRIRATSLAAILAVQPGVVVGARWVSAVGAARRVQALALQGWTTTDIAAGAGAAPNTVWSIAHGHTAKVDVTLHDAIAVVFTALWDKKPGDDPNAARSRTIARARAAGWVPALAWDDIDDPNEKPQGVAAQVPA